MIAKIAGYEVKFPHQPYGVQYSYMNQILRTLDTSGNALLEAPTGCGKTLSLLCGALAWQQKVKADLSRSKAKGAKGKIDSEKDEENEESEQSVPKIMYATRTHSQIAQVVRELKRTGYTPKMVVLASRSHYCVNKSVVRSGNVDEECESLLRDDHGCRYHKNVQKLCCGRSNQILDIEEMKAEGVRLRACPYFAARQLSQSAELIFCPYSYLLDPVIRRAMDIDIKEAVLIFDEAHNIEDTARDAASCEVDLDLLQVVHAALVTARTFGRHPELYQVLEDAVGGIILWLQHQAQGGNLAQQGFERFEAILTGPEAVRALEEAGLGAARVEELWETYQATRKAEEQDQGAFNTEGDAGLQAVPGDLKSARAGALALGVICRLLMVLRIVYGIDGRTSRIMDYRLAIQKWVKRGQDQDGTASVVSRGRRKVNTTGLEVTGWGVQVCMWALKPSVVFEEMAKTSRSVVLTSGTLSPMDSFASELGTEFHYKLEAPHVVDMTRQVWAGVLPCGPDNVFLNATYKEADKLDFQDRLGNAVVEMCRNIPDGVLLFLPSYSLMDKLMARWKATGLWAELSSLKEVVTEPRQAGADFEEAMSAYYKAVETGKGGLFMAVCRGKASEGIDFADANARGVMVVGIPFPHAKDTKVNLKKSYNNMNCRQGGCLSGDLWYSQQAFRALNQAVGRCIRHRYDYGAIILVDERFRHPRHQGHLSKWVRGAVKVYQDFGSAITSMKSFFKRLEADPPRPPPRVEPGISAPGVPDNSTGKNKVKEGYEADVRAPTPEEGDRGLGTACGKEEGLSGDCSMKQKGEQNRARPPVKIEYEEGGQAVRTSGLGGPGGKDPSICQGFKPLQDGGSLSQGSQGATHAATGAPWQRYPVKQEKYQQGQPLGVYAPRSTDHQVAPGRSSYGGSGSQPHDSHGGHSVPQASSSLSGYLPHPRPTAPQAASPGPNIPHPVGTGTPTALLRAEAPHYATHPPDSSQPSPSPLLNLTRCQPDEPGPSSQPNPTATMPTALGCPASTPLTLSQALEPLLTSWVLQDISDFKAFLSGQQQEVVGQFGPMDQVAPLGILECFSLAQEVLGSGGRLEPFWDQWQCAVPRGILAAAAASGQLPRQHQEGWAGVCQRAGRYMGPVVQALGAVTLPVAVGQVQREYSQVMQGLLQGAGHPSGGQMHTPSGGQTYIPSGGQQVASSDKGAHHLPSCSTGVVRGSGSYPPQIPITGGFRSTAVFHGHKPGPAADPPGQALEDKTVPCLLPAGMGTAPPKVRHRGLPASFTPPPGPLHVGGHEVSYLPANTKSASLLQGAVQRGGPSEDGWASGGPQGLWQHTGTQEDEIEDDDRPVAQGVSRPLPSNTWPQVTAVRRVLKRPREALESLPLQIKRTRGHRVTPGDESPDGWGDDIDDEDDFQ